MLIRKEKMKKTPMFVGLFLLCVMSSVADDTGKAGGGDMKVTATVNLYSGRAPPVWDMPAGEIEELKTKLSGLPSADKAKIPEWGYVIIENDKPAPAFPYKKIYVFNKLVVAETESGTTYYKDTAGIMEWLMDLGNKHDPTYVPPPYTSMPPNTARIVVLPASLSGNAQQGAKLEKTLTIFSEGSGPLTGTITPPAFMSMDKKEFSLPAIEGIEDFTFLVDTSKAGELRGEITLKSNDPERSEMKIPVAFTVLEKEIPTTSPAASTSTVPPAEKPSDYVQFLPYMVVIIILIIAAILAYKKIEGDRIRKQREEFRRWKEEKERSA